MERCVNGTMRHLRGSLRPCREFPNGRKWEHRGNVMAVAENLQYFLGALQGRNSRSNVDRFRSVDLAQNKNLPK